MCGHIYDWCSNLDHDVPYTTDPKYKDEFTWGDRNKVFFNGRDVSYLLITRIITGSKGQIEFYVDGPHGEGKPLTDGNGDYIIVSIRGNVEYRYTEERECVDGP